MEVEEVDLDKLVLRLLNAQTREAARQEIQAWPIETLAAMLRLAIRQEQKRIATAPQKVRHIFRRLLNPTESFLRFPLPYDWLVIVYAEQAQDTRFLNAVGDVLARYYAFRKAMGWLKGDEEEDGPSSNWSNGVMMKQPRIRFSIGGAAIGYYNLFERPLLSAMLRLLPRIQPQDRNLTSAEQHTLLQLLRFPYRDVELTLCILDFLTTTADVQAIQTLELTERTAIATANGQRIRAAANACLAQVRPRAKQAFQSQTLLRPAGNDTLAAPAMLLRPVSGDFDDPADELLRPTAHEDTGR